MCKYDVLQVKLSSFDKKPQNLPLSEQIVCLPHGSDNQGFTLHVYLSEAECLSSICIIPIPI